MKKKIIYSIVLFTAFSLILFFSQKIIVKYQAYKKELILLKKRKEGWLHLEKALTNKVNRFKGTIGLVVKDLDKGWEIAFNRDTLIPSASLVKVPIMLSCFYAEQDKNTTLKHSIRIRSFDIVSGSRVLGAEPIGSVFTVEELFDPMITQSDNAAANVLIDYLGFDTLNHYFKKMGLRNTNIVRKMMDFTERKEGKDNYTTAGDMAFILEKLYYGEFVNRGVSSECLRILGEQKINDRIPKKLPPGTFVTHKTGLEKYICHDAGIVFTGNGNFLVCVLVKHEDKISANAKKFISDVALLTYNYLRDYKRNNP
ncbi:MAG: class A beta-lactamase-related serine hydrolase [Candidatus Omnitrophica bacterium]|nr:class A beta-lactamase-related serine hydrolase [Candidatus Omnitrophota bacterium]